MQTTCILKIGDRRISGSGQREKSRWKHVLKDLLERRLIEDTNGMNYILTDKGFKLADRLAIKYDFSISPLAFLTDDGISGKHIVEIKRKIEETIIDRAWVVEEKDVEILYHEPWKAFKCSNLILKNERIQEPEYGNGLIKVEPFGIYDEGILVFTSESSKEIKVAKQSIDGEEIILKIDAYVLAKIPFRNITEIDPEGSENYPYPTLYCRFYGNNPYEGTLYVDKENGYPYEEDEIYET